MKSLDKHIGKKVTFWFAGKSLKGTLGKAIEGIEGYGIIFDNEDYDIYAPLDMEDLKQIRIYN